MKVNKGVVESGRLKSPNYVHMAALGQAQGLTGTSHVIQHPPLRKACGAVELEENSPAIWEHSSLDCELMA